MITKITTLGRSGLYDWMVQRISSVIIAIAAIGLIIFVICNYPLNSTIWHNLFSNSKVKILTILTILSLILHSWIGMWSVLTDYIKCTIIRLFLEITVILLSVYYLLWTVQIIWKL